MKLFTTLFLATTAFGALAKCAPSGIMDSKHAVTVARSPQAESHSDMATTFAATLEARAAYCIWSSAGGCWLNDFWAWLTARRKRDGGLSELLSARQLGDPGFEITASSPEAMAAFQAWFENFITEVQEHGVTPDSAEQFLP